MFIKITCTIAIKRIEYSFYNMKGGGPMSSDKDLQTTGFNNSIRRLDYFRLPGANYLT